MSGHSKWSNIKRKKGVIDAKKSLLFTKLIKEIYIAIKIGGNDPSCNFRLKSAIQSAKNFSVPKDNIEKALKKGSSQYDNFIEINYEGVGPFGSCFIVECYTDNLNRTTSDVRSIFNRCDGNMVKTGSFSHIFDKKKVFVLNSGSVKDFDNFFMEMIDFGVEDLKKEDDQIIVLSDLDNSFLVQKKIHDLNLELISENLEWIPRQKEKINSGNILIIENIIENLENLEDVQNIYHNIE
jgi:YebC/PmpR family DNA-binding regulatory protein